MSEGHLKALSELGWVRTKADRSGVGSDESRRAWRGSVQKPAGQAGSVQKLAGLAWRGSVQKLPGLAWVLTKADRAGGAIKFGRSSVDRRLVML